MLCGLRFLFGLWWASFCWFGFGWFGLLVFFFVAGVAWEKALAFGVFFGYDVVLEVGTEEVAGECGDPCDEEGDEWEFGCD